MHFIEIVLKFIFKCVNKILSTALRSVSADQYSPPMALSTVALGGTLKEGCACETVSSGEHVPPLSMGGGDITSSRMCTRVAEYCSPDVIIAA